MKRTNKPEKSRFHDRAGNLTRYAFGCGYVECYVGDDTATDRLTLSREPNDWHVKGFVGNVHCWEIFEDLTAARNFCRAAGERSRFIYADGKVRPVPSLAPLLRRARDVVSVTVRELPEHKALLLAVLPDGVRYGALFESFTICRDFATSARRKWRGVPVIIHPLS